jgi:alanine-glyoxylate transaminase/serine-glyoxylate transaminase/serine-pyruvate transaminase
MIEAPDHSRLDIPQRILLGPGPSMVHPRVMLAMGTPVIGHLDPLFLQTMDRLQELLRYAFQTTNPLTLAVPGTGSAAMEAAIAGLVEPGDAVLICVKGFFGRRLVEMARRHGGDVQTLERPWGEVFSAEEIAQALRQRPAKVVAIVHAETSTGVLQPLEGIAEIVHAQGGLLVVDAVTSLGGVPLQVDALGIDVCYSCTQKCIGAPPGLGPITVSPRAAEVLGARKQPVTNWYLDLTGLAQYWGEQRVYHHTAPCSADFALYEALRLIAEEGLEARWARHRAHAELLWDHLERIGLELFVPRERRLPTLTAVRVPEGVDEAAVRRELLTRYNIEIGAGLGDLKGKIWRIGLMGYSSRRENILMLAAALDELVNRR